MVEPPAPTAAVRVPKPAKFNLAVVIAPPEDHPTPLYSSVVARDVGTTCLPPKSTPAVCVPPNAEPPLGVAKDEPLDHA